MPRKNNSARRRNQGGFRNRRQKGQPRVPDPKIPRVKVEDLVLPDGQCNFPNPRKKKAFFATAEKAARALRQAQHQRARTGSRHVEKRFYKCPEGGCGGYHLTSRETFDESTWNAAKSPNPPGGKHARSDDRRPVSMDRSRPAMADSAPREEGASQ